MIKKLLLLIIIYQQLSGSYPNMHQNKTMLLGNIQFPKTLQHIPQIRVYTEGTKIVDCTTDDSTKQVSFTLSADKYRSVFYIVITPKPGQKTKDPQPELGLFTQNTIDYLRVPKGQNYKIYKLELTIAQQPNDFDFNELNSSTGIAKKTSAQAPAEPIYTWNIQETKLPSSGRLPDDTIIICYNPDYVDSLKVPDNDKHYSFKLPSIIIKDDVEKLAGSEENLRQEADYYAIAALDSDTFHSKPIQTVKIDNANPKRIVAITA